MRLRDMNPQVGDVFYEVRDPNPNHDHTVPCVVRYWIASIERNWYKLDIEIEGDNPRHPYRMFWRYDDALGELYDTLEDAAAEYLNHRRQQTIFAKQRMEYVEREYTKALDLQGYARTFADRTLHKALAQPQD